MAMFLLSAGKMDGVSSVFVEGALHQVSESRIPSILRSEFIFDDFSLTDLVEGFRMYLCSGSAIS